MEPAEPRSGLLVVATCFFAELDLRRHKMVARIDVGSGAGSDFLRQNRTQARLPYLPWIGQGPSLRAYSSRPQAAQLGKGPYLKILRDLDGFIVLMRAKFLQGVLKGLFSTRSVFAFMFP